MSELINQTIKIEAIELPQNEKAPVKVKVKDKEKGTSYVVWKTKSDGTESRAWEFVKKIGLDEYNVADYEIGYSEEERSFTDKKGKDVSFKQRTIRAIRRAEV